MNGTDFTCDDLDQIFHLCDWVVLGDCPAPFDFRLFLLARLQGEYPELAAKLERLDEDRIEDLCREVVAHQRRVGAPAL